MRHERFSVPGPIGLVVRLEAGEVRIESTDAEEASVELEGLNAEGRKAVEDARVWLRGDELLVEIGGWRFGRVRITISRGRVPEVRAVVRVPHGSRLSCDVVSASVEATGRFGESELQSVSGDVRVDDIEGPGSFRSVSGDVVVRRVAGGARVNTVSGDVTVRELGRGAEAKSVSGDLLLGGCAGGSVTARSVSGNVVVEVQPGVNVWMDVKSISGSTTSELAVGDEPPAKGATMLEVRATSVSGDIRLVRGAHAIV